MYSIPCRARTLYKQHTWYMGCLWDGGSPTLLIFVYSVRSGEERLTTSLYQLSHLHRLPLWEGGL